MTDPTRRRRGTVTALPGPRPVVPLRASLQGTLALDLVPEMDPPAAPRRRPREAGVAPAAARPGAGMPGDADLRTRRDLERWAHRYVQAAVEIAGGDRPATQLLRWTARAVYLDLERRGQLVARASVHHGAGRSRSTVRPHVLSVHVGFVGPGTAEVCAHVRYGGRSRAVAARFERADERWTCTALEFA
ncbi:hypothetical protein INN71_05515 [Nocardioides sp. ChNu-153]|uniref:Rv3235 family protein n=1 Tax=unclassified Nocardioides TaxID=2615069 RepID=UPI002404F084|nr:MULTISPECIES: Rv3235 family protein [unclassified Nocardioides]MDF9717571.1 hypothetical protein [Nocardioides sp. ChNu-99]MDN7120843.1 hypothetical protein [Nocardioides sp. ChNu-153]